MKNKITPFKGFGEFYLSMTLEEVRAYLKNKNIPFKQERIDNVNETGMYWNIISFDNKISMYFAKSTMFEIDFMSPSEWELENGIRIGMLFEKAKEIDPSLDYNDEVETFESKDGYRLNYDVDSKKIDFIAIFIKDVLNNNMLDENGFYSYKWVEKINHAQFSKEMLKDLKRLKYSTFEKYIIDNKTNGESTYCKLGIETNKMHLDILNKRAKLEWNTPNRIIIKNEIAIFSCGIRKEVEDFNPNLKGFNAISKSINEKIKDVQVVTDIIRFNSDEYTLIYDTAIIIKTEVNVFIISRKGYINEEIYIYVNKEINDVYTIEDVKKSWSDEGKINIDVNRIILSV